MRLAVLASVGVIALSAAALAQVTGVPDEQKVPAPGAAAVNELPPADNTASTDDLGNEITANTAAPPSDMAPAPHARQHTPRR